MNKSEAKAAAKKASDNLDSIADKAGDAVVGWWPRIKASPYTWVPLVFIGAALVYAGYKLIGLIM